MDAGACVTLTCAVALTAPAVAVMTALPEPFDVTRPVPETVATAPLLVDQATFGEEMVVPAWSVTVAESCCVAPTVLNVSDAVLSTMPPGTAGSVALPPHAASRPSATGRLKRSGRRAMRGYLV